MTRTVRIVDRARRDLARIAKWIRTRSPQGATTWLDVLDMSIRKIGSDAERYPVVPEATPRWKRKVYYASFKTPMGRKYRIVFEWDDVEVRILRIRRPGDRPLKPRDLPKA